MSADATSNAYAYAFGRASALATIILDQLAQREHDQNSVDAHRKHLADIRTDLETTITAASA